jgi:hypothetical protein
MDAPSSGRERTLAPARGRADPFAAPVERPRPARGRFTILDLAPLSRQRANDCRFMRGRFFCGGRTRAGASWCDAHAAVVFEACGGAMDRGAER